MKVKIGNTIYDSNKEPIMLILDAFDRENIENMDFEATRYCAYSEGSSTIADMEKWMDEV